MKKLALALSIVFCVLFAALMTAYFVMASFEGQINNYFNIVNYKIVKDPKVSDDQRQYFKSEFKSNADFAAFEKALCEQVEAEGAVLLKNAQINGKNALPLAEGAKVSLFSASSVDIIYGGTGSGSVNANTAPKLNQALTATGLSVNSELWNYYVNAGYKRSVTDIDRSATKGEYKINEAPWEGVKTAVGSTFSAYGDAAIFTLARGGGEGGDLWREGTDGENGDYLALSKEEQDTLKGLKDLKDSGTFKKIIVLINSSNLPHASFIDNESYGIDAVLWLGGPGQYGLNAVGNILAGKVNPSGKLADTFVYDNFSAPAMVNFGDMEYSNYETMGLTNTNPATETDVNYVVYQEGIYVGYKYYETRYEDVVLGNDTSNKYNYAQTVAYPFGFGLSYTSFEWTDFEVKEKEASYEISLTVTNNGLADGKEVVEIYLQKPYTDYDKQNGIEKSAVELVGFVKTGMLAKEGGSEPVTVSVPKESLKCYDAYGKGTYILEKGTYYLTAASDAHAAVNNILAKKNADTPKISGTTGKTSLVHAITVDNDDFTTYATENGVKVENQLSDIDLKLYSSFPEAKRNAFNYLSRSDWEGTWPKKVEIELTKAMADDIKNVFKTKQGYEMPAYGEDNGLRMLDLKGAEFNDERWDKLLNQMSFDEQVKLVCDAFHQTHAVESIGKPGTFETNGPQGITDSFINGNSGGTAFPAEVVMCASWNTDLMADIGRCFGEQGLAANKNGIYGPAANIHRTAYCGRNYEYFSEDGFLSGAMAAPEVAEIEKKGVVVYMKHYALNDQETNRAGVCTFANENTVREIYLKPFEMAVKQANVHGFMTVMNRVGTTWGGAHYGMLTAIPRGEWGFEGAIITDCTVNSRYTDSLVGLQGGSDFWDGASGIEKTDDNLKANGNDPYVCQLLRQAVHRMLYVQVNSSAMNGLGMTDKVVGVLTWWQSTIIAGICIFGVLAAVSTAWCVYAFLQSKKQKQ